MRQFSAPLAAASDLLLVACASMSPSERNALGGAAIGGAAGGLIGQDAGSAALGAVVGGAGGWYLGCREERRCR